MPSLSTYIGFIPGAQVIAFGVGVLEWISADMLREMDEMVDEQMWKVGGMPKAKVYKVQKVSKILIGLERKDLTVKRKLKII